MKTIVKYKFIGENPKAYKDPEPIKDHLYTDNEFEKIITENGFYKSDWVSVQEEIEQVASEILNPSIRLEILKLAVQNKCLDKIKYFENYVAFGK